MGLVDVEYRDAVCLIRMDNPPVNALGAPLRQALLDALDAAFASPAKAIILYGAGRGFSGGADINEFDRQLQEPDLQLVIEACESREKPVIAAIHGIALGGALEVALGCSYRVALADAMIGLPEVKIGVLPGGGGTQRLPRLIGVEAAVKWMTTGNPVRAKRAAEMGVIDQIIEGDLIDGAIAFAGTILDKPISRVRDRDEKLLDLPADLFDRLRATVAAGARNLVAPLKIVDAVEAASKLPFDAGIIRERELFEDCRESQQAKALIHVFFAEREVWKLDDNAAPRPVKQVAVIGAGTMGGGIAMAFINAGYETVIVDATEEALGRGVKRIEENYAASVAKGRLAGDEVEKRLKLLKPSSKLEKIAGADLIIEAIFERMDVKQDMFRRLDGLAKPGAILATNTSMLDVNEIAAVTQRPSDVIGLHFFSPANVMRLLEVVRGEKTAPDVLATALAVTRRIGKVPAVVGVCDGFVGNRMIEKYFREAEFLVAEGASPAEVDRALTDFGLAMGPFAMSDMAGVDVRWDVFKRKLAAIKPGQRYSALVDRLASAGRYGQKTNAGFYLYKPGSRTPVEDPALEEIFIAESARQGVERRRISAEEIVQRCLYALVNEGAYILQEKIAARAGDIDVVYVNGYGFPAYRGGPMFWAEAVGLSKVLADIETLQGRFGDHWQPSALLQRLGNVQGSNKEATF